MAPKSIPPLAKQNLILSYLRSSQTVHNIKELEKALPSVASINGMQVKDYLQALSDENKIHVDKIGSGNWYWSFPSEEKKAVEGLLQGVKAERDKLYRGLEELKIKITEAKKEREGDDGGSDRKELTETVSEEKSQVEGLRRELEGYSDSDPSEVLRKMGEVGDFKTSAERWTNNIYVVEGYIGELSGGDREALEEMRRTFYGKEYVEGEGLREL